MANDFNLQTIQKAQLLYSGLHGVSVEVASQTIDDVLVVIAAAQQSVQRMADPAIAMRCEHGYGLFEYCPVDGCIRHRR